MSIYLILCLAWDGFLNWPAFECQHRSAGKHQDRKCAASRAAATALINTYTLQRVEVSHSPPCKNKRIRPNGVCYLDVELPGQSGSNSGAHVTQEAVQEQEHFSRSLSPTSAPLIHDPWAVCRNFNAFRGITGTNIGGEQLKKQLTENTRGAESARTESWERRGRKVCLRHGTNRWRPSPHKIQPDWIANCWDLL